MFSHVAHPRAVSDAADKAAWLAGRAVMTLKTGQDGEQALGEAGDLVRRSVLQVTQVHEELDHRQS